MKKNYIILNNNKKYENTPGVQGVTVLVPPTQVGVYK